VDASPHAGGGVSPIGADFRFVSLSKGVQGPPCRGVGCPHNLFSSLLPPEAAGEEKERVTRGHPLNPAKGRLPLGTPLKSAPMGVVPAKIPLYFYAAAGGARGVPE
jgi:hypothetical protein